MGHRIDFYKFYVKNKLTFNRCASYSKLKSEKENRTKRRPKENNWDEKRLSERAILHKLLCNKDLDKAIGGEKCVVKVFLNDPCLKELARC